MYIFYKQCPWCKSKWITEEDSIVDWDYSIDNNETIVCHNCYKPYRIKEYDRCITAVFVLDLEKVT